MAARVYNKKRWSVKRYLERAMGIEPTSLAWEARVMAIIRRPQEGRFYRSTTVLSIQAAQEGLFCLCRGIAAENPCGGCGSFWCKAIAFCVKAL